MLLAQALWAGHWGSLCVSCKIVRPLGAKHCGVLNKCVSRFDHYCPWVGNAIGKGNIRDFVVFLLLESIALVVSLGCALSRHAPSPTSFPTAKTTSCSARCSDRSGVRCACCGALRIQRRLCDGRAELAGLAQGAQCTDGHGGAVCGGAHVSALRAGGHHDYYTRLDADRRAALPSWRAIHSFQLLSDLFVRVPSFDEHMCLCIYRVVIRYSHDPRGVGLYHLSRCVHFKYGSALSLVSFLLIAAGCATAAASAPTGGAALGHSRVANLLACHLRFQAATSPPTSWQTCTATPTCVPRTAGSRTRALPCRRV